MGRGFEKNVLLRIKPHHVVRGIVAQHMDQRGIHIEESAIDARSINAVYRALYERAIPRFGMSQRFFVTLVVDRAGQLLRDERQDFLVALAETHILVIALNNQNSEGLVACAQGYTHPVNGRGPQQLHFAAGLQFFEDLGGRQQGFPRAKHVLGEASTETPGSRCGVLFIHKMWKAQHLGGGVVQRNVKVPRVHQLADNVMNRGIEALQVRSGPGALCDPIECRTQNLRALVFFDVAVQSTNADLLISDQHRRARNRNIEQRAVFSLALGLERNFLTVFDRLFDPVTFCDPLRGYDEFGQSLAEHFCGCEPKHARELRVDSHYAMRRIENGNGFRSAFHQLIQICLLDCGVVVVPGWRPFLNEAIFRRAQDRRSPAPQRLFEILGAHESGGLGSLGDVVTHTSGPP